jgi:hypothetical protein
MTTDYFDAAATTKPSVVARVVCFVVAILLGLLSALMTLFMLLANMNIHFSSSPQLGMFLAGWTFVGTTFVVICRLLIRPSFKSLWLLILPALCMAMIQWLIAFPENQHLMH